MIEVALVFDEEGRALHWHLPPGCTGASIPDSRSLWEVLWQHRHHLGGVAHTHPLSGPPEPSHIDLTTWSACERALGARLAWPIVTFTEEACFVWSGPGRLDYARRDVQPLEAEDLDELRRRSEQPSPSRRDLEELRSPGKELP